MMTNGIFTALLVAAVCHLVFASTDEGHFIGGTMSFEFVEKQNQTLIIKVTHSTGWTLGKGPCGPNCTLEDYGRSTDVTRDNVVKLKGKNYFGSLYRERINDVKKDFEYLSSAAQWNVTGKVTAVNEHILWEQEILTFTTSVNDKYDLTYIGITGLHIRESDYERTTNHYDLNVKVTPGKRNDTGQPNNSPVAIFKPLYQVSLNSVTKLTVSVMDKDDDIIKCEDITYFPRVHVNNMKNTSINKDCSIEISTYESDGFKHNGWGFVLLVAEDFSRHDISIEWNDGFYPGRSDMRRLDSIFIQFMVLTVENLTLADFVSPTKDTNHEFIVYIGSTFSVDLWASPASSSSPDIKSFLVHSVPDRNFTVLPPSKGLQGNTVYSKVTWKPEETDIGKYLIRVFVLDTSGNDGVDRSYTVVVRALNYTIPKHKASEPYFASLPASETFCRVNSTCTLSVYTGSQPGTQIVDLVHTNATAADVTISPVTKQILEGRTVYHNDVSFISQEAGPHIICLRAKNTIGEPSDEECINVIVEHIDACNSLPCRNGGQCHQQQASFVCTCTRVSTGSMCETIIDLCASNPCHQGQCYFRAGQVFCFCHHNYTGKYCQFPCSGVGVKDAGNTCICPFGITGTLCESAIEGKKTHSLILESGSTLMCSTNDCTIPIFSQGPSVPDISIDSAMGISTVDVGIGKELMGPSQELGMYLTPVTVLMTGNARICINLLGDSVDPVCYDIETVPSTSPNGTAALPTDTEGGFSSESLQTGSRLRCSTVLCHQIVLTKPYANGSCSQIMSEGSTAFKTQRVSPYCVTDVAYNADSSNICIHAGDGGEKRCYGVEKTDREYGTTTGIVEKNDDVLTDEAIIGISIGAPVSVIGGLGLSTLLIKCVLKCKAKDALDNAVTTVEDDDEDEREKDEDGEHPHSSSSDKP